MNICSHITLTTKKNIAYLSRLGDVNYKPFVFLFVLNCFVSISILRDLFLLVKMQWDKTLKKQKQEVVSEFGSQDLSPTELMTTESWRGCKLCSRSAVLTTEINGHKGAAPNLVTFRDQGSPFITSFTKDILSVCNRFSAEGIHYICKHNSSSSQCLWATCKDSHVISWCLKSASLWLNLGSHGQD